MSRSIRQHFNELLKEHDARKPSHQGGYRRNIGKRSRKEINVGGIHEVSGLFDSYGSESDLAHESPSVLKGPSTTSNRHSLHGGTHSTPLHGGDLAQEHRPSPAKKSRLNADARIQNITVSIATQTLQDIDLNEEDELEESSFTDEDRPNVTYRHVGTQMESSNVRRNSTFRHGTSRSFRSERYSASLNNPPAEVIYMDAGTSGRRSGSRRKSSQIEASKSSGDLCRSRMAYSSGHENHATKSLTMYDRECMPGDEENDLPYNEVAQHDMQSTSRNTGSKSRFTHTSHSESTSKKVVESAKEARTTPVDRRNVLDAYTEMIDSQRKMTSSRATGNSPSKGSSRKKLSSNSLRKRLSIRNDAIAKSPFAPSKDPGEIIKDLISPSRHGDANQIELDDILDVYDDASTPKSPMYYSRRRSGKLRFVRTEPKPTRKYGEGSSNPAASSSSISNRNQARQELSFSGRHPQSNKSSIKKKLTSCSKAKKSLDYPSPAERSSQKRKNRLSRHSENRIHTSIHHETAAYSLVDYSVSDEDSAADEAERRTSRSRLSRNELNHSQKKQRRSSRLHRGLFKSMREENMAAEVESTLMKNGTKRDAYSVTSDDDGNVIRLSTGRRKSIIRSRIPISSSSSESGNNNKLSMAKWLENDSPSDNEEHPMVIENPPNERTSPKKSNDGDVPRSHSQRIQAQLDGGDGPVPVSKNVEDWLRTAAHPGEKVSVRNATQRRRSKYSFHDSTAESLRPFGDASVIRDRESINLNRFNSSGNNYGPPSSTPRAPKSRTKPIPNVEVSEEGEGDDLIGLTEESGHSRDSYTMTSRRRSRKNDHPKTVPKNVDSPARAKTPSYQPTPKYRNSISARKKLSSSFAQTNPDNASQAETNDTARVVGSPSRNVDIAEVHDVSVNNIPMSVNMEDDDVQENTPGPGPAKSGKRNAGKRASKVKKNTKSKPVKPKKVTPRDQPIVPSVNNSDVLLETEDYVVLPLPSAANDESGVRRSARIRTKVFGIGEGFEYSNTFDENGFPKIIGIRVKKDTNTGNRKKGSRAKKNKTKSKSTAKKNQKKGKKTKVQGTGTGQNSTNVPKPDVITRNSTNVDVDVHLDANVEEPDVSNPTTLPTISEEGEPPDVSGAGDASANRTIPIQERTVNLLNSTTNSYNTIDFLSIVSHDDGLLGMAPPAHKVVSGIEITRGINLSDLGISSCVQGRIVIKPRKKKAERMAGSGTMCFFVHQGSVEVSVSGESVLLPYSSYFQVPHKNRYSLYNPDKKIDTILFYALNLDRPVSERT